MVRPNIDFSSDRLAELCRRHGIARLSLFGSALHGPMGPESDVDLLIEFERGRTPGWEIVDIADELSTLFGGRKVDLINPKYIHHRLREQILADAMVQYEAPNAAR